MLSASEARRKTQNNIDKLEVQQFNELNDQINRAINAGRFSITGTGFLRVAIREKLEELGYKVQLGSQYNDEYYKISWE